MTSKAKTSLGNGLVNAEASDEKHVTLRLDDVEFDPTFNTRFGIGSEAETSNDGTDWATFVLSFDMNAHTHGAEESFDVTDPKKPLFATHEGDIIVNGTPKRPFAGIKQDTDIIVRPNARKGSRKAYGAIDGHRRDVALRTIYKAYGVPVKDQTVRAVVRQMSDLDALAENIRANQDRRPLAGNELTAAVTRYIRALESEGYIAAQPGAQPSSVKTYSAAYIAAKLGISRQWAQEHLKNAAALNMVGGKATDSMLTAIRTTAVDLPVRTLATAATVVSNLVKKGEVTPEEAGDKLVEVARQNESVQRAETRKAAAGGDVDAKVKTWTENATAKGRSVAVLETDGLVVVTGAAFTDPAKAAIWAGVKVSDMGHLSPETANAKKYVRAILDAARDGYRKGIEDASNAAAKARDKAKEKGTPSPSSPASATGKGKSKAKGKGNAAHAN